MANQPKIVKMAFSSETVLRLKNGEALNLFYSDKSAWRFEADDGRTLFVVVRNDDLRSGGYDRRLGEAQSLAFTRLADGSADGDIVDLECNGV